MVPPAQQRLAPVNQQPPATAQQQQAPAPQPQAHAQQHNQQSMAPVHQQHVTAPQLLAPGQHQHNQQHQAAVQQQQMASAQQQLTPMQPMQQQVAQQPATTLQQDNTQSAHLFSTPQKTTTQSIGSRSPAVPQTGPTQHQPAQQMFAADLEVPPNHQQHQKGMPTPCNIPSAPAFLMDQYHGTPGAKCPTTVVSQPPEKVQRTDIAPPPPAPHQQLRASGAKLLPGAAAKAQSSMAGPSSVVQPSMSSVDMQAQRAGSVMSAQNFSVGTVPSTVIDNGCSGGGRFTDQGGWHCVHGSASGMESGMAAGHGVPGGGIFQSQDAAQHQDNNDWWYEGDNGYNAGCMSGDPMTGMPMGGMHMGSTQPTDGEYNGCLDNGGGLNSAGVDGTGNHYSQFHAFTPGTQQGGHTFGGNDDEFLSAFHEDMDHQMHNGVGFTHGHDSV